MPRTIENVETIGIYPDEIRILSSKQSAVSVTRSTHRFSTTDVMRVDDEVVGMERRLVMHFKDGVHCNITDTEVNCGLFIGQTFYIGKLGETYPLSERLKHDRGGFDFLD